MLIHCVGIDCVDILSLSDLVRLGCGQSASVIRFDHIRHLWAAAQLQSAADIYQS
jgi:hypothetical protein